MTQSQSVEFDRKQAWRAGLAAFVGTMIEWYDFYVYATASALVFGPLFFPDASHWVGIMAAFATYAVGFVFRPLGSIIWGHIGDRFGRRPALVSTLLLMGSATVLVGFLPTTASIGIAAPILLILLRLLQGLAVGGEWGGAVLMATEHVPAKEKTFFGGFPQLGNSAGALAATGIFSIVTLFGHDALMTWGWRVPFIASIVLVMVGFYVRYKVEESPVFKQQMEEAERTQKQRQLPIKHALTENWKLILLGIGGIPIATGGYYLVTTFTQAYGTGPAVGMSETAILNAMSIASFFELVLSMFIAKLGDIVGRKQVIIGGLLISAALIAPMFLLMSDEALWLTFFLVAAVRVAMAATYAPLSSYVTQMFQGLSRYTSVSLTYGIGAAIYGGFAPVTAAYLYSETGTIWSVLILFFVFTALNVICVLCSPQHGDEELEEEPDKTDTVFSLSASTGT